MEDKENFEKLINVIKAGWVVILDKLNSIESEIKKIRNKEGVLTHKGFIGSIHFNSQDMVFHGKIESIADLITFEATTVEELENAFKEAVEDYLELKK
jgi:hypothetical protein